MQARVKLYWTKSVSEDVAKQVVKLAVGGSTTEVEVPAGVEEYRLVISASTDFSFSVDTHDADGNVTASETHSGRIGDLIAPEPATGLGHVIEEVIPDEPPTPSAGRR